MSDVLSSVVGALKASGVTFALVHESALMGWGIDNSVFLEYADVLLPCDEDFGRLGCVSPAEIGGYAKADVGGIPARLWSRAGLGLAGPVDVTSCPRYGCEAVAPETVLRKLAFSPDYRLLAEQRARLAAILHARELTDDELGLVARYVRGI